MVHFVVQGTGVPFLRLLYWTRGKWNFRRKAILGAPTRGEVNRTSQP